MGSAEATIILPGTRVRVLEERCLEDINTLLSAGDHGVAEFLSDTTGKKKSGAFGAAKAGAPPSADEWEALIAPLAPAS